MQTATRNLPLARPSGHLAGSGLRENTPRDDVSALIAVIGADLWQARLGALREQAAQGPRHGRALMQRHAIELTLARLATGQDTKRPVSVAEQRLRDIATDAVALLDQLAPAGRARLVQTLRDAMEGSHTLLPVFHLLRMAALQRSRGFAVEFAGLEDAAPFDLLLHRDGIEAELVCETISAEAGRDVHRGAWFRLADRIDPELQLWLAAHPGRYLLKMTLPQGLRAAPAADDATAEPADLAELHRRITALLASQTRSDQDEAAVLRLDPLLLAAAQADDLGLMPRLRQEFGPEAHLAVTTAGRAVFVMAGRAGRADAVAEAMRQRLLDMAPRRLTGQRPGILAVFIDDVDRAEWRGLREQLELEGAARQFLIQPEARQVVAVSCSSRLELFGIAPPDGAAEGELRFRSPTHQAARSAVLAPAVLSCA